MNTLSTKQIVLIVVIVIAIAAVAFLVYRSRLVRQRVALSKSEIIAVAENYLANTYEQEMIFEQYIGGKENSFGVTFSKKSNPDFVFQVTLSKNKDTEEYRVWKDNYYEVMIRNGLIERFKPIVHGIWNSDAYVIISVDAYNIISVDGVVIGQNAELINTLDEYSTIDDIAFNLLKDIFTLLVYIPYFNTEEDEFEAIKIHHLIELLREGDYLPSMIMVSMFTEKDLSKPELIWTGSLKTEITPEEIRAEIDRRRYE